MRGKKPEDRTIIIPVIKTVSLTIYVPMAIVSIIGIILPAKRNHLNQVEVSLH